MLTAERVYGLDIETDTTLNGFDPLMARITDVCISTQDQDFVFADEDERSLLKDVDELLRSLPAGLVATWNGCGFDLPFLSDRYALNALPTSMHLLPRPGLTLKYPPVPGHDVGYDAVWDTDRGQHQHMDISYAYTHTARALGLQHALKPVCRGLGVTMVELDRTRLHEYTPKQRRAYVASDARAARVLTLGHLLLDAH